MLNKLFLGSLFVSSLAMAAPAVVPNLEIPPDLRPVAIPNDNPSPNNRTAQSLQKERKQLDPRINADQQFDKVEKALSLQCSVMTNISELPENASESVKLTRSEILDQFIYLSYYLIMIDGGAKRGMDCFMGYYSDHKLEVHVRLKTMNPAIQKKLDSEIKLFKHSTTTPDGPAKDAAGGT